MKTLSELPNVSLVNDPDQRERLLRAIQEGQNAAKEAMRERERRKEQELHLFPFRF